MLENLYSEREEVVSRPVNQDSNKREKKGKEEKRHTNTSVSCTISNKACFDKTVIRIMSLLELLYISLSKYRLGLAGLGLGLTVFSIVYPEF